MLTKMMAMRKMNEMWKKMALTLVFCVLLFHTCQGQDHSTVDVRTHQSIVTTEHTSIHGGPPDPSTTSSTLAVPDPSTTSNSISAVTQVTDHAVTTTKDMLPRSQPDTHFTSKQGHQSLATSAETTSHPMLSSSVQEPAISSKKQSDNYTQEKSGTTVFMSILVSGLILAAALIGLYVLKNRCHTQTTDMKLAEESYISDEDNQGNTLLSVAPLNPPENQEKPRQNGEPLEAMKTQNPPAATNGHSATKADTEL